MNNQLNKSIHIILKRYVLSGNEHYSRLKQGLWLYLFLLISAHPVTGKLVVNPDKISSVVGLSVETIHSNLGHLKKQGYLRSEKEGLVYVVSLHDWPGKHIKAEPEKIPDENLEDNSDRLTAEDLSERLGNSEGLAYYSSLCERYPQDVLVKALEEVEAIPPERIKKSKGALYTYLVKKYAKEEEENKNTGN